jgi:hypothetical protein
MRRRWRGWKSVAVIRRTIKVRVQTRSLRLAGGFRICHYIDTRIRYGHAAMYDRPLLGTTDAPRTNDQRQKPGRSRGLQLVESSLGSRKARKGPIHQNVSRWLVKDDLQMTAQPASSPGRGRSLESVAGQGARRPEWDAGRELSYAACAKKGPSLGQDLLTMEPETTIRSRKRPVI